MTSDERFQKNFDAFVEIRTANDMETEERSDYFDEMLKDILTASWPTKVCQDN